MIIKKYSCKDCLHTEICCYEKDMIRFWDKLEKGVTNNDIFYPITDSYLFPSVAYYSLQCKYFIKK